MSQESIQLHDKRFVPYMSREEIAREVQQVALRLEADLPRMKNPIAVCMLNGAFVFAADLMRAMNADIPIEFVRYSSYEGLRSSGVVRELIGLHEEVEGRDVIIIEDIIDSGLTMSRIFSYLHGRGVNDVHIATMFIKRESFQGDYPVEYIGHELPNLFVVGYGLDYDGKGRSLSDLYILEE